MTTSTLSVTMLGAGQEVGRSCCVLNYKGITVVCDAGIHPAHSGIASLPFIDALDWSTVDAILITHFHLDHIGALTYITEKTNFRDGRGKVYMTHPTKAIYKLMMQNFVQMSESSNTAPLFTSHDLASSLPDIIPISTHQLVSPFPRLSFTPYNAGHVIGACMYMIEMDDLKVLYTGDYSREETRHLPKAEIPPTSPDVLIIESTHGVHSFSCRDVKEKWFINLVHQIIRRDGHVLLPVFALGQAQELMLVLEAHWNAHPELHSIPIYCASDMINQSLAIYQAYIHTLSFDIRKRFARQDNPFHFSHITFLSQNFALLETVANGPPCVVLATSAMLQNGASRSLLEMWAPDARNGLIITGYSAEGTLARDILQNQPNQLTSLKGTHIPCRLLIQEVAFSAHVDFAQNVAFIEQVDTSHIVLVHGEQHEMYRLKEVLQSRFDSRAPTADGKSVELHMPRNLVPLSLNFNKKQQNLTRVVGKLASNGPQDNASLSGLLVSKESSSVLFDPAEDSLHVDNSMVSVAVIVQRQRLSTVNIHCSSILQLLENMFGPVEKLVNKDGESVLRVMKTLSIQQTGASELTLEWISSPRNDIIADTVVVLFFSLIQDSLRLTNDIRATDLKRIQMILEAHFGNVKIKKSDGGVLALEVTADAMANIYVDLESLTVSCSDKNLRERVNQVLRLARIGLDSFQSIVVQSDSM